MKKRTITGAVFLIVFSVTTVLSGEEAQGIGVAPSAEHGLLRLSMPMSPSRHLSVSAHGGYALTESMGPVSGAHHRFLGTFSVSGAPIEMLSLKLSLQGYHDRHPKDEEGGDTTTVGVPLVGVRLGNRIGKLVQLGAAIDWIIPGDDAPSLSFEASTLEPRILFALAPIESPWRILFNAGYRWDNSGKTAPDATSLRPGDRISIGTSEFDAVLLGIGGSYCFSATELLAEVTTNLFVGNGAPTGSSPVRLGVGVRHRIITALQLSLLTETLLSGRPGLDVEDPIMPVEPRFSVQLGVTYTFDFGQKSSQTGTSESEEDTPPEPAPEATETTSPRPGSATSATLEGRVVDEEGNPIGGTKVSISVNDDAGTPRTFETTTDSDGGYKLTDLPIGTGTVSIETEGFDPVVKEVQLTEAPMAQEPDILTPTIRESPTQLRGQIRSIDGNPLKAKLTIKPGGETIETDEDGYFTKDLPNGAYRVMISAPGYTPQKKRVVIEENSVTIINVDLRPKN